jgi:hypothetical protein
VELKCHADIIDWKKVSWFGGLTCDFWAENGKRKMTAALTYVE